MEIGRGQRVEEREIEWREKKAAKNKESDCVRLCAPPYVRAASPPAQRPRGEAEGGSHREERVS